MARAKRTDNKGRVLRVGEQQRSEDGRYLYRYTDLRGRKKTIYANTLPDLRQREEEIQRDLRDGIETTDLTLNELFEIFMRSKQNLRGTTIKGYETRWRTVFKEPIGGMKVAKVKQIHIVSLLSELSKTGAAEGTLRTDLTLLSSILELAVESDMIRRNPAKGCSKYITGTQSEREAMTRAEQAAFMEYVNSNSKYCVYAPIFTFILSTGLRVGEATGLRWSDIDLKENVLHVNQQLVYCDFGDGYRLHIQSLKTKNAYRTIPLTDAARQSLVREKELDLMLGREIVRKEVEGISDFVFINREGRPHSTSALNQVIARIVRSYNESNPDDLQLPHISCHILRHTFCSRMVEAGIDVKTLQYLMGHADVGMTLNRYAHMDFSTIKENVEEIQEKVMVG